MSWTPRVRRRAAEHRSRSGDTAHRGGVHGLRGGPRRRHRRREGRDQGSLSSTPATVGAHPGHAVMVRLLLAAHLAAHDTVAALDVAQRPLMRVAQHSLGAEARCPGHTQPRRLLGCPYGVADRRQRPQARGRAGAAAWRSERPRPGGGSDDDDQSTRQFHLPAPAFRRQGLRRSPVGLERRDRSAPGPDRALPVTRRRRRRAGARAARRPGDRRARRRAQLRRSRGARGRPDDRPERARPGHASIPPPGGPAAAAARPRPSSTPPLRNTGSR